MDLDKIFREALDEFLAREFALIRKNVQERAICARLAWYLEVAKHKAGLDDYYADVEYDRHGELQKTMFNLSTGEERNIVCDLLLHSRGEQKRDNLICLEMKKASGTDKQTDRERLQALTSPNPEGDNPLHVWDYEIGYYLEIDVKSGSVIIEEYRGGKMIRSGTAEFVRHEDAHAKATTAGKEIEAHRDAKARKRTHRVRSAPTG